MVTTTRQLWRKECRRRRKSSDTSWESAFLLHFFFITQTQGIHRLDSQILMIFLDIIENIFGSMMKRKFNMEMQGTAKGIK